MKYTTLGNTDIKISKLSLGLMGFGRPSENFLLWTLEDPIHCDNVVKHAFEKGINYFDTANIYIQTATPKYILVKP